MKRALASKQHFVCTESTERFLTIIYGHDRNETNYAALQSFLMIF
jgi:hypothetical protein